MDNKPLSLFYILWAVVRLPHKPLFLQLSSTGDLTLARALPFTRYRSTKAQSIYSLPLHQAIHQASTRR